MKVVLFCGGLGLRLREASERVPKPMVPIGTRPVLWHVMKYYAHFGHTDFVLCLGHKAEVIKEYFLTYQEALTNDFVLSGSDRQVTLKNHDLRDWQISFCDTGLKANVGSRLAKVRSLVEEDDIFLANYGDTLNDAPLPQMIDALRNSDAVAIFISVKPQYSFHLVQSDENHPVTEIRSLEDSDIRINGGYFAFRPELFDYMRDGEEMVEEPFRRLAEEGRLLAYKHDGFWAPMDTLKDKQSLDAMVEAGGGPWQLWLDGGV